MRKEKFKRRDDVAFLRLKKTGAFCGNGEFFAECEKNWQIRDGFGCVRQIPKFYIVDVVLKQ